MPFTSFECKTVCKLEKADNKFQITEAVITPVVRLENNELQDKAIRVLEKSKQNCLVTNSIKTEITLTPQFL